MKLIDADALHDCMSDNFRGVELITLKDALEMIELAPTIDVMEVGGMNECKYCYISSNYLGICENAEPRIFITVSGAYLQVFDEEYPGFIDNIEISYCPMCGRKLREE